MMFSIAIAGLNTLNCVKRSKLGIFSLEPQGHVIAHALKCEKTITWIPITRHVEKLSFPSLNLWLWLGVKGESDWNGIERKTDPLLFVVFASESPSPSLNCNTKNIRNIFASFQAVFQSKYYQSLFRDFESMHFVENWSWLVTWQTYAVCFSCS